MVEGEILTSRNISRGAARFRSGPYPAQSVYKRYSIKPRFYLPLFADDTYIYILN
jgi:hypothetical protein